jgi:hypothetical protein
MTKRVAEPKGSATLYRLTVRLPPALVKKLEAYAVVTGRSYQDLTGAGLEAYLDGLDLPADEKRKVRALLG